MIRALIRLNGGRASSSLSAVTFKRNVEIALEQLRVELDVDLSDDILPLLELALGLRTFLDSLGDRLTQWARKHPVCSRLMDIPGVGPICAISFYSAIEDPTRFEKAIDVGPYLGLTPLVVQSGKTLRHSHISKRGNKLTRSHLTLAASSIINRCGPSPLKAWAQALAERAGPGKARVALARKLAVRMLAIWKSGQRYDPTYEARRLLSGPADLAEASSAKE
jgi:transposase